MRLGRGEEAVALAERAVTLRPRDLAGYTHLTTLLLRLGDLAAAAVVLNRALEIEPTNLPLLRRLADIALRQGKEAEAFTWLRRALETAPKDPHSYDQLASLELARGDQTAAEAALTQAATNADGNPAFHRRLSDTLNRRGDEQGALYWAQRMVEDFPSDPAGFSQLGALHLSANRLEEAESAFLQAHAMARTPGQAIGPLHRLSDVATRRNNIGAALGWAGKAIETAPREAVVHYHIAAIHLSYRNLSAAEKAAQRAVEIVTTDVGALRLLSEIAARQGKRELALDLARKAVSANPDDAQSHDHEASVLLEAGDMSGALSCMERALKLAPTHTTFLRRAAYLRALSQTST
jgi:tetratricopeptide (TPR) repeat protein